MLNTHSKKALELLSILLLFNGNIHNVYADGFFNRQYDTATYSYDISSGLIIQNKNSQKASYNVGLILDSGISNPPTTGLLYKTIYLCQEMVNKGHSYTFFICNRNFIDKKQLDEFKLDGITVHILEEKLFYDIAYMSKLLKQNKLDVLQYEAQQTYLDIGVRIKQKTGLPSVLVLHDIEDELMTTLGRTDNNQILDFIDYTASHLADALMTLTEVDREKRIKKHGVPENKIFVTPIGVNKNLPFKGPNLSEKIIGLVGNQFYEPNLRASAFLIEKVLPLVHKQHPEAKVKIIGMCPKWFQDLHSHRQDVIFTGELRNNKDYIDALASLSLGTCCVDSGCGMNVKITNYCGLGLPVILTPICYTGYEKIQSLILVDLDPEKISEQIHKIFTKPCYAKKLGQQNYELSHELLSWSNISVGLEKTLDYAYSNCRNTSSRLIQVKPIWLLENRHRLDVLKGHHIIKK